MVAHSDISIPCGPERLPGFLDIPDDASGVIIFAHGSGSGKESPRNQLVARELHKAGFATVLFDLLTEKETEHYRQNVFDMKLLTGRLDAAVSWAQSEKRLSGLPIGLAGASTGAGAALNVAGARGNLIKAVVSRGGRPDLAEPEMLEKVTAPTAFIVGGDDTDVIGMNKRAAELVRAKKRLILVPGATHVFEEPGTVEQAAEHMVSWFSEYLR